jgi:ABC-2 type transport system permease protein
MRPLMLFGVLYAVFSLFLDVGENVRYYPSPLLLGIVALQLLQRGDVELRAGRWSRARTSCARSTFPRLGRPAGLRADRDVQPGAEPVPVFVFLLASGGRPRPGWLALPILLGCWRSSPSASGCCSRRCSCASATSSRSGTSILQITFYATPIFYPIELLLDREGPPTSRTSSCATRSRPSCRRPRT